jgi:hypothetical protein
MLLSHAADFILMFVFVQNGEPFLPSFDDASDDVGWSFGNAQ